MCPVDIEITTITMMLMMITYKPLLLLLMMMMMSVVCMAVGYTMDTMYFGPLTQAIDIAPDLELPQFSLVDKKHSDCSMNYTSGIVFNSDSA